jgi:glutamyl-tRNA reductase
MSLFLIGIDHKTAPIDIREVVYGKRKEISAFWENYAAGRTAILSTCNRFEIYGFDKDALEAEIRIDLFKSRFEEFFNSGYFVYGSDNVFRHIARLAAGLESQIKGESQIYAQLDDWARQKNFPKKLTALVHDALLLGSEIRSVAGLKLHENNIATLLYRYLLSMSDSDDLLNVVVAGTGKIARLFAEHKPKEARLYFAAHKNIFKAHELAEQSQGYALMLRDLPELLLKADILISATSSPHRIFDKDYFSRIAALREKKLHVYDLAVPRAVDPETKNIDGIVLNNIDDLNGIFEKHNRSLEVIVNESNFKNRYAAEPAGH